MFIPKLNIEKSYTQIRFYHKNTSCLKICAHNPVSEHFHRSSPSIYQLIDFVTWNCSDLISLISLTLCIITESAIPLCLSLFSTLCYAHTSNGFIYLFIGHQSINSENKEMIKKRTEIATCCNDEGIWIFQRRYSTVHSTVRFSSFEASGSCEIK